MLSLLTKGCALIRSNLPRVGSVAVHSPTLRARPRLLHTQRVAHIQKHQPLGAIRRASSCGRNTMEDEYGEMDAAGLTYSVPKYSLESGQTLENVQVRYKTFGTLNESKSNVMVVCHALTGNAALDSWWGGMLGPGLLFDTDQYFVVCANILGSCYGTTGPTSINQATGKPFGVLFPDVTIRDSVGLHIKLLQEEIGVKQVACVIGGSLGGMQTLEWGLMTEPGFVRSLVPMCCGAYHHPWQIGISETQRQAIYADPNWRGGNYSASSPPYAGLSVARQIAMVSYRSHQAYSDKFGRKTIDREAGNGQRQLFDVENYLRYQGERFCNRFDPLSYVKCTRMMDTHDVGRNRGGYQAALAQLGIPTYIVAVDSDALYPPSEQEELHRCIPNSRLHIVKSPNGHDGFLLDQDEIMRVAKPFIDGVTQQQLLKSPASKSTFEEQKDRSLTTSRL